MHAEGAVDARNAGATNGQQATGILTFSTRCVLRPFGWKRGFDASKPVSEPTPVSAQTADGSGLRYYRRQATGEAAS